MAYDIGDFGASLDLRDEGYRFTPASRRARKGQAGRQAARHRGLLLHRGLRIAPRKRSAAWAPASACGNPRSPRQSVGTIEILTVRTATVGPQTTFAQLVAERLGIPISQVQIVHGDTDKVQFGMGTYARAPRRRFDGHPQAGEVEATKAKKIARISSRPPRATVIRERRVQGHRHRQVHRAADGGARRLYRAQNCLRAWSPALKEGAFYDPTNFHLPAGAYTANSRSIPAPQDLFRQLRRG